MRPRAPRGTCHPGRGAPAPAQAGPACPPGAAVVSQSARASHESPERGRGLGGLSANRSQGAQRGWTGSGVPGGRKPAAEATRSPPTPRWDEKPAVGGNPPPLLSSGAVEVAPNALGVDHASVVPRGPARAVPVSSGGLGGRQCEVTPAVDRSRFPPPDEMEARGERGPGPAPSRAGNARMTAPVAAGTADPVSTGESRSPVP